MNENVEAAAEQLDALDDMLAELSVDAEDAALEEELMTLDEIDTVSISEEEFELSPEIIDLAKEIDAAEQTVADNAVLEEALNHLEREEARLACYKQQDAENGAPAPDLNAAATTVKTQRQKRVSLTATSALFLLEIADESLDAVGQQAKHQETLDILSKMNIKGRGHAENTLQWAFQNRSLSVYMRIGLKFLLTNSRFTIAQFVEHLKDQKANGVKGYSQGTANAQAFYVTCALQALKIVTKTGKEFEINPNSTLVKLAAAL
jgi:hypothetical protein